VARDLDSISAQIRRINFLTAADRLRQLRAHMRAQRSTSKFEQNIDDSFFLLAAYVAFDAAKTLIQREPPHASIIGICLSIVSLVVMPLLARAKRRVAARLESRALVADSRQTDLCAYLSAILLVGLALNALLGWWWADSLAALIMVPIILREGTESFRGEICNDCH